MNLIPAPYRWAALALLQLALLAGAAAGGWHARSAAAERDVARLEQAHAQAVADSVKAAQAAEQQARAVEARRVAALQEIADAERLAQPIRNAARARARGADDGLRAAARAATDALAAEAARDTPAAERSQAVAGAGLVFTDVLGSCSSRLTEMAAELDEALARGTACERSYRALSVP